jgi:hypothetical protein
MRSGLLKLESNRLEFIGCYKYGLPPGSVANLQRDVDQSVAIYGIELNSIRKNCEIPQNRLRDLQMITKTQARAATGAFE